MLDILKAPFVDGPAISVPETFVRLLVAGALATVGFRIVVRDTHDTACVIRGTPPRSLQRGGVMSGRILTASLLAVALAAGLAVLAQPVLALEPGMQQAQAAAKAPQAWPPDPDTLRARRLDAENLPLFSGFEPIDVTITADFKKVQKDRSDTSKTTYPGTLSIVTGGVAGPAMPVQMRTRGHVRRNVRLCDFAPLWIEFQKADVKGTVFQGQRAIKLGTHCQSGDVFEQYVLKEHLVNRISQVLTPRSLRSRLAHITYVDSSGGRKPFTKPGIFFEDVDDVARRMEAREEARLNLMFRYLDQPSLLLMSLFQYMIGNTDYSIIKLHNVRILVDAERRLYPVPYDFDYSGLVQAHYATPAKVLDLSSVRDRRYRGPCKSEAELQPAIDQFLGKKDEILALPAAIPGLADGHRKGAEKYLNEFFDLISRPDRVTRTFIKDCEKLTGM
jgi:hypothetical protein